MNNNNNNNNSSNNNDTKYQQKQQQQQQQQQRQQQRQQQQRQQQQWWQQQQQHWKQQQQQQQQQWRQQQHKNIDEDENGKWRSCCPWQQRLSIISWSNIFLIASNNHFILCKLLSASYNVSFQIGFTSKNLTGGFHFFQGL